MPDPAVEPRAEAAVLAVVRAAGGRFRAVVFTDNRRTMASVAAGGDTLRLHRSFAKAPEPVLRAVARYFTVRSRRERVAAREVLREFFASLPAQPRVPRRRRVHSTDHPHLERLRAEFDRVNREYFDGALPSVPLFLSGRMKRRNGHFSTQPLEIVISRRLCTDAPPDEAEQTLRHEMIHLWQHVSGRRPDHGTEFRRWARILDVHPRAMRLVRWTETVLQG